MEKKVLFVWFKRYEGILDGGGQANFRCFNALRRIFGEEAIDSLYVHDGNHEGYGKLVCSAFYTLFDYHNGLTPGFVRKLVEMASAYDYVFLSTSLFGLVARELKRHGYGGKIIVHFHNVESVYYDAYVPKWLPGRQFIIRCADHNDGFSCRYADKVLVLNERDGRMLEQRYGRCPDAVLPLALPDSFLGTDMQAMTSECPLCVFIGSCFPPNNEGVLWFVRNVLPHVHVRFKVVGKGMSRLKAAHECLKDIDFVSDAPDLRPYFEEADFVVLPIFSGSGMKVKTCEALMHGKNILGTDEAFEGYMLDTEKIGGRCNTAADFIARLEGYSRCPVRRFNSYARSVYLQNYSDSATENIFRSIFNE